MEKLTEFGTWAVIEPRLASCLGTVQGQLGEPATWELQPLEQEFPTPTSGGAASEADCILFLQPAQDSLLLGRPTFCCLVTRAPNYSTRRSKKCQQAHYIDPRQSDVRQSFALKTSFSSQKQERKKIPKFSVFWLRWKQDDLANKMCFNSRRIKSNSEEVFGVYWVFLSFVCVCVCVIFFFFWFLASEIVLTWGAVKGE